MPERRGRRHHVLEPPRAVILFLKDFDRDFFYKTSNSLRLMEGLPPLSPKGGGSPGGDPLDPLCYEVFPWPSLENIVSLGDSPAAGAKSTFCLKPQKSVGVLEVSPVQETAGKNRPESEHLPTTEKEIPGNLPAPPCLGEALRRGEIAQWILFPISGKMFPDLKRFCN